jgi:hypothetical protein
MWISSCAICKALLKAEIKRFRGLSVWTGVVGAIPIESQLGLRKQRAGILEVKALAKVIEFYIPNNFRKSPESVYAEQRGKIIEFAPPVKKSA